MRPAGASRYADLTMVRKTSAVLVVSRNRFIAALAGLALLLACPHAVQAAQARSCGVDPRAAALIRLEASLQGKSAMLPNGCSTLALERVCVPRVTVDEHRLADLTVLAGDVAGATGNPSRRLSLSSLSAIRAGVAEAVFKDLVAQAAQRDRIQVSMAAARAFAQHERELYRPPSPRSCIGVSPIPRGMTPRQYFLSPRTIAAYRFYLVIGQEEQRIVHRYPRVARQVAFRRWLQQQTPHHTILINGATPSYSIADAYPAP